MKKICIFFTVLFLLLVLAGLFAALLEKPLPIVELGEKVGLIKIEGPIFTAGKAIEQIEKYEENSSVKALVIRVNSPGGAVVPSHELYEKIKKASTVKPVVVSMGSLAASGGYYLSAGATKIVANPGTITGSIGVIMEVVNVGSLMEKIGIKSEVVKSGKHKDLASVFRGIGEEEREILQASMDDVHSQFIEAVAKGRNMPVDEVTRLADGRIFTGRQALSHGLVDELGTLDDAVNRAAKLANIKGKPQVITPKEPFNLEDFFNKTSVAYFFDKIKQPFGFHYMLTP